MDALGNGLCRKRCTDEFGSYFNGVSDGVSRCLYGIDESVYADESDADEETTAGEMIVITIYFCGLAGPTVLGGCLFCYAYKDSERKRKAHEEKKRQEALEKQRIESQQIYPGVN